MAKAIVKAERYSDLKERMGFLLRKYINQQDMKRANAADIFALIRERPGITRKQIELMTEFSWGAVSNITGRLLEQNYIVEYKNEASAGAGRTPYCLSVNEKAYFALGLDLNSSGFSAVVMNLKNECVDSMTRQVQPGDREALLKQIESFVGEVVSNWREKLFVIGVAMQGVVNAEAGLSVELPHCPDWKDVPLADILAKHFGIPAFLEHDPNCILYAHSKQHELNDALLLRVDRGIGMSVMIDGQIQNRLGMYEIGHTNVVRGGALCACGRHGCLEAYASMRGMERRAKLPFEALARAAESGDETALRYFAETAEYLAVAVANSARLLNISNVILCGEIWRYKDLFYNHFLEVLKETSERDVPICSIIESGGAARGAALIAVECSLSTMQFS